MDRPNTSSSNPGKKKPIPKSYRRSNCSSDADEIQLHPGHERLELDSDNERFRNAPSTSTASASTLHSILNERHNRLKQHSRRRRRSSSSSSSSSSESSSSSSTDGERKPYFLDEAREQERIATKYDEQRPTRAQKKRKRYEKYRREKQEANSQRRELRTSTDPHNRNNHRSASISQQSLHTDRSTNERPNQPQIIIVPMPQPAYPYMPPHAMPPMHMPYLYPSNGYRPPMHRMNGPHFYGPPMGPPMRPQMRPPFWRPPRAPMRRPFRPYNPQQKKPPQS